MEGGTAISYALAFLGSALLVFEINVLVRNYQDSLLPKRTKIQEQIFQSFKHRKKEQDENKDENADEESK